MKIDQVHAARPRAIAVSIALVLLATSCGGKEIDTGGGGGGGGGATTTVPTADAKCTATPPEATDVGVTADTITIAVVADTGSSIRPGLFQGSVDGVKAWAAHKNANGGLGCRQVVVKDYDSKLSPSDAKNAILSACTDAFVMVGTTATFLNDVTPMEQCPDKSGAITGLPDLALLQTEPAHQCSAISFVVLPTGGSCPYSGTGDRTFQVSSGPFRYYLDKVSPDLHGVWVIPKDLPSTISSSMPGFRASQEMGIKLDAEFGASGLDTQSAHTPPSPRPSRTRAPPTDATAWTTRGPSSCGRRRRSRESTRSRSGTARCSAMTSASSPRAATLSRVSTSGCRSSPSRTKVRTPRSTAS